MSLQRTLEAMHDRIMLMLSRGTLERVDDTGDLQQHQVSIYEDDVLEEVERVGQYGFASNPIAGAALIIACVGGHRSHPVVLGVDDKSRPHPLPDGASCLYDKAGTQVYAMGDGNLLITCSGTLTIDAPNVHITGNLQVDGTINGHMP